MPKQKAVAYTHCNRLGSSNDFIKSKYVMMAKRSHPLLIRGEQLTEKTWIWTLKTHPHTVAGSRRGFEVRVYHYPAEGWDPYFVAMISNEGWLMNGTHAPTAAAAESAALEMLNDLQQPLRSLSASDAVRMIEHVESVDRLTAALIATIDAAGVSHSRAQHALAQTLGQVIGSRTQNDAAREAAVALATRAIADSAQHAAAKNGRNLRPTKSRLN
jgi:hypothetical protein